MTSYIESEHVLPWQRKVTLWVAGLLLLLVLVFVILWQLRTPVVNRHHVTYLNVISVHEGTASSDLDYALKEQTEDVFYQYASIPVDEKETPLQVLTAEPWQGWESLLALKAPEEETPYATYRLTLRQNMENESEEPSGVLTSSGPSFRTIVVNGVPVQPVEVVPEPSSGLLLVLSSLLVWRRRR